MTQERRPKKYVTTQVLMLIDVSTSGLVPMKRGTANEASGQRGQLPQKNFSIDLAAGAP